VARQGWPFMKKLFFSWIENHLHNSPQSILLLCDLGYPEALPILDQFPQRVFNVGVSEQNAALMAKGLCSEGFEVFIYGISSFTLWRSAEALKLYFGPEDSLRIIGNGGGLGYGRMGTTHHSLDDLGLVSLWPAWTSWIPARDNEVADALELLTQERGPQYLRLTNNPTPQYKPFTALRTFSQGRQLTVVTMGPLLDVVLAATKNEPDIQLFCIGKWPLDIGDIQRSHSVTQRLLFIEEHQEQGGIASQIKSHLEGTRRHIHTLSVTKSDITGSRNYLLKEQGLDEKSIASQIFAIKNEGHDND